MSLLQATLLGIVQGLTEFLPVSSSGHLILAGEWIGTHQSLAFDVALHGGTLAAVLAVFGKDYLEILRSLAKPAGRKLAWFLVLGTIPAVVFGVMAAGYAETAWRSHTLVAFNLIIVALMMLAVERVGKLTDNLDSMNSIKTLGIGIAQAASIIPGISRSGATITSGMMMGLTRKAAMRFSFLLSGPIIAGAALKVLTEDGTTSQIAAEPMVFAAGVAAAAVSGYWTIRFMLKFLEKHPLDVFAYYRLGLGILVLVVGLV